MEPKQRTGATTSDELCTNDETCALQACSTGLKGEQAGATVILAVSNSVKEVNSDSAEAVLNVKFLAVKSTDHGKPKHNEKTKVCEVCCNQSIVETKETCPCSKTDDYDPDAKKGYAICPSNGGDKAKAITTPCGCETLCLTGGAESSQCPVDDAEEHGIAELKLKQEGCNTTTISVLKGKKAYIQLEQCCCGVELCVECQVCQVVCSVVKQELQVQVVVDVQLVTLQKILDKK